MTDLKMIRLDNCSPDGAINRNYHFQVWYSTSWQNAPAARGFVLTFYDGYFFQLFLGTLTGNIKTRVWNGTWQSWQ